MSGIAQWPVQQAAFAALSAAAAVTAFVSQRIYDAVPPQPTFPYIEIGETSAVPFDTKSWAGEDASILLHVWSQYRGRKECKQILDAIHATLHEAALTVSGHNFVLCRYQYSDVMRDPDGLTYHGVIRFRVLTHA